MSSEKQYFRGYAFAPKGKGKKANIERGNVVWTEEEVSKVAYKAARIIYRKYGWVKSKYDEDDFVQDAVMSILKGFRDGYFIATTSNIFPIVYRLIDGYFVYNKLKKHKVDSKVISLNDSSPFSKYNADKDVELLETIKDTSDIITDIVEKEDSAANGKNIILSVIETFSAIPIKTRKHVYVGVVDKNKKVNLSESVIASLVLSGKDLHDILNIFGFTVLNSGSMSQTAYIAKIVRNVTDSVVEKIKALSNDDRESVKSFLELSRNRKLLVA